MKKKFFLSALLLWIMAPRQALAYIDPGTGSIILQVAIGGIAAVLATGKIYWYKIKWFFFKGPKEDKNSDE